MFVNCRQFEVWITNDGGGGLNGLNGEAFVWNLKIHIDSFYWAGASKSVSTAHFPQIQCTFSCTMHKTPVTLEQIQWSCIIAYKVIEWKPFLCDRQAKPSSRLCVCVVWMCVSMCGRYPFVWLSMVVGTFFLSASSYPVSFRFRRSHFPAHSWHVCFNLSFGTFAFKLNPHIRRYIFTKNPLISIYRFVDSDRHFVGTHTHTACTTNFSQISCSYVYSARQSWIFAKLISRIFSIICNFRYGESVVMHTRCSYQSVRPFSPGISFIFMAIVVAVSDTQKGNKFDRIEACTTAKRTLFHTASGTHTIHTYASTHAFDLTLKNGSNQTNIPTLRPLAIYFFPSENRISARYFCW